MNKRSTKIDSLGGADHFRAWLLIVARHGRKTVTCVPNINAYSMAYTGFCCGSLQRRLQIQSPVSRPSN